MHETSVGEWTTPRGNRVSVEWRRDTVDGVVIAGSIGGDEYGTAALFLSGWAFDIGSYIGTVAMVLALDNPRLRVIALEPVPENLELCRRNVQRNGLGDRVRIVDGAIARPGQCSVIVRYRCPDDCPESEHTFVGNSSVIPFWARPHECREVAGYSLTRLTELAGEVPSFVKMDCEGGEWDALADPVVVSLPLIHGEYHPTGGHTRDDLEALLAPTHELYITGPDGGHGAFRAVRRGGLG